MSYYFPLIKTNLVQNYNKKNFGSIYTVYKISKNSDV